jgi:hypothetical protein
MKKLMPNKLPHVHPMDRYLSTVNWFSHEVPIAKHAFLAGFNAGRRGKKGKRKK